MWITLAAATELPLERLSTGHLAVDVALDDGATHRFLLDTGAGVVTLSPALAEHLGIGADAGRVVEAQTANGTVSVRVVTLDGITLAGVELTGVRAAILDLGPIVAQLGASGEEASAIRAEFARIEGVLGRGFFERVDVALDLRAERIGLWSGGEAPTDGAIRVPFRLRQGVVEARGHVGGERTWTLVDLGANGGQVSRDLEALGQDTGQVARSMGAEGHEVAVRVLRFEDVALGDVAVGPLDLHVCAEDAKGAGCPEGKRAILGVDAVAGRSVIVSYARRALYVGPR